MTLALFIMDVLNLTTPIYFLKIKPHQIKQEPSYTAIEALESKVREQGYAVISPSDVRKLLKTPEKDLHQIATSWDDLPADQYLKDGGKYRLRRHASIKVQQDTVDVVPHRAHWQPTTYNALHGGMHRWFEPIKPEILSSALIKNLLTWFAAFASKIDEEKVWFGEAHQFRIDTSDGIGRPTPEGAHRDGVDWVAVLLLQRFRIKGGETRVFEVDTPNGQRFTLNTPWTLLLLDDRRVIHETTPIQPTQAKGWRDTLIVTLRSRSFLSDISASQTLE
tara:strand:+ start:7247 stop:8077 length:831 start_codon:yes stop_codon:yes gene_type:complete